MSLEVLEFDAAFGSVEARREAFRAAVAHSVDVDFGASESFTARLGFLPLGEMSLGLIEASAFTAYRTLETVRRLDPDPIFIDCFPEGGFDAELHGQPIRIEDGDCVVFDQTCAMRLEFQRVRCVFLTVPHALFERQFGRAGAEMDGFVLRGSTPEGRMLGAVLQTLLSAAPDADEAMRAALADGALSMAAACLTGEGPSRLRSERGADWGKASDLVARIERFCERNLAHPELNADRVGAVFGLKRNALYRLFAEHGGMAGYLRTRRAEAVERLLGEPEGLPINAIARRTGFRHERTLRKTAQALHGAPLSVLRRRLAEGQDPAPGDPSQPSSSSSPAERP